MANRYWVGGTATWAGSGATTMWSDSSGGPSGASRPTASDDVFFDTNSGISGASYTVTLAALNSLPCKSISIVRPSVTGTVTFTNSGSIECNGNFSMVSDGVTWTGTSAINFLSTASQTITTGGFIFPVGIVFNGAGGSWQLQDNFNTTGQVTLTAGTIDLNSLTLSTRLFAGSNSNIRSINFGTGGQFTITNRQNSTVWNVGTATNFSYTGTGQVNFTATFPTGAVGTRNIVHGSSAGGSFATKAPPMYIYNGILDDGASLSGHFSDIVFPTFTTNKVTLSVGTRTIYGNLILAPTQFLNGGAGVTTFAGSGTQTFDSAGSTSNFPITIGNGVSNGTVQFADSVTTGTSRAFTLISGTLDLQGFNLTTGSFVGSGSNIRALDISNATVTLTGVSDVFTVESANLTFTGSNSTIIIDDVNVSGTDQTFNGGGLIYDTLVISGDTSSGPINFTGNNQFDTITSTKIVNQIIKFEGNSTTTVGTWDITGTVTAPVLIDSYLSANQHSLILTSGTVNVSYYNINNSNASPANTWYALLTNNNTDSGNNTGWIFDDTPAAPPSTFFLLF